MKPLTPTELAAMKERLEKATPGPWAYGKPHNCDQPRCQRDHHASTCGWNIWQEDSGQDITDPRANIALEDAQFIAHSRTDMERLIAEVERLRGVLAKIAGGVCCEAPGGMWDGCDEECQKVAAAAIGLPEPETIADWHKR